jgi:two-component system, NarL family, response regulator NreC
VTDAIRVQLCDDHALVRAGLRRLLEGAPDVAVVGESADADEAIAQARMNQPDVLLLDLTLPGRSGIEAMPELAEVAPATRVLVLTMHDDPAYVRQAFAAGAAGYILKEAAEAELVTAIRTVAAGHPYLHPMLGARLANADRVTGEAVQSKTLSERERDVLHLLALGHTNKEIARLLFISVRTAETHRARIMQKLGIHSRAELVRYALAAGMLEHDHMRSGSAHAP